LATNSGVGEIVGVPEGARLGGTIRAPVGKPVGGTDAVGELDGTCEVLGAADGVLLGFIVGAFVGGEVVGESDGAGLVVGGGVFCIVGLCDKDGEAELDGPAEGIGVMGNDGADEGTAVTTGPSGSMYPRGLSNFAT